jgi:hypothetical protein
MAAHRQIVRRRERELAIYDRDGRRKSVDGRPARYRRGVIW